MLTSNLAKLPPNVVLYITDDDCEADAMSNHSVAWDYD